MAREEGEHAWPGGMLQLPSLEEPEFRRGRRTADERRRTDRKSAVIPQQRPRYRRCELRIHRDRLQPANDRVSGGDPVRADAPSRAAVEDEGDKRSISRRTTARNRWISSRETV